MSSSGVIFTRRAHVTTQHLAGSGVSVVAVAYAVLRTLHEHALLAVVILGCWALFCALVLLNLPRLVYLVVDDETVRQRRYLLKRRWPRAAIGGLVRVDLAYPGAKEHTVPTAVLTDHASGGLGVIPLINWADEDVRGLESALGVPVSDHRGKPVTPDGLNTYLPGAMTGFAPYAAYFEQAAIAAFILVIIVALTVGVVSKT